MSSFESTGSGLRLTRRWRRALLVAAVWVGAALAPVTVIVPPVAPAQDTTGFVVEAGDTTAVRAGAQDTTVVPGAVKSGAKTARIAPAAAPLFASGAFDTIPRHAYLMSHSFSLDHFLELEPGLVLRRLGPIGKSAKVSRYGFGRGRAMVFDNGVPINDPENDIAPITHFPASAIGRIVTGSDVTGEAPAADGIEGSLRIVETPPPRDRPNTFIEVSKGTNDLRQRRVRFSSQRSGFGLDLGYDELLNDGYSFDARQLSSRSFISGSDFGKSRSRHYTLNLRGGLPTGEEFVFSFRRFTSNSDGDLSSRFNEERLSGHLAAITARVRGLELTFFERGYNTKYPDSNTVNQTTAGYLDWRPVQSGTRRFFLGAGFEDIVGTQRISGFEANPRIRKSAAHVEAVSQLPMAVVGRVRASGTDYHGLTTGWGGTLSVGRRIGRHTVSLETSRGYRMPNLGELFLPAHPVGGGVTLAGNRYVKSESAWETGGRFSLRWKGITNELRLTAVQVEDPILFLPGKTADKADWRIAANGPSERMGVVENRLRVEAGYRGIEFIFAGSASRAGGDRDAFFLSVPKTSVLMSARLGGAMFERTSALYIGFDYAYGGWRRDFDGSQLQPYDVVNFRLDGRLLDADMYLVLLNAFDERYQTAGGYLMTPRTFVYGLAWTLFE